MTTHTVITIGEVTVRVTHDDKHVLTTQDIDEAKRFAAFVEKKCCTKTKKGKGSFSTTPTKSQI